MVFPTLIWHWEGSNYPSWSCNGHNGPKGAKFKKQTTTTIKHMSRSKSGQMRSPYENIARVPCDTCSTRYLGRIIRKCHSRSHLTQGQFKLRSKKSNYKAQNFLLKHAPLVQFCLRIPDLSLALTYHNVKRQNVIL